MNRVLFLIGALAVAALLGNIVAATFFWHPQAEAQGVPVANAATLRGQEPWADNELHTATGRDHLRKGMLEMLGKPWSSFCTADGHKQLIETVNNYYYQRLAQHKNYASLWGGAGERFIVKAWATADDNRIERLASEHFSRGYFALDELRPYARKPIAELVKGAHVTASPCAG